MIKIPECEVLDLDDNTTIYLCGTAHVSQKSADDVEYLITSLKPDFVAIELCKGRIGMLKSKIDVESTFFEVYRRSDSIAKAVISYFNMSIARRLGTIPVSFGATYARAVSLRERMMWQNLTGSRY